MKKIVVYPLTLMFVALAGFGCNANKFKHDASGTIEATEVIVSALTAGQVEELNIVEGQALTAGQYLGYVDTTQLYLQKLQLLAGIRAINRSKPSIAEQIAVTKEQITKMEREKARVESLYKDGAATSKQLDDAESQLAVLKRTLTAQTDQLTASVNSISGEGDVREVQVAQVNDQLAKSRITSPIDGTVLSKYTQAHEVAAPGTPLFKIADTRRLFVRAYIVASQLDKVKLGQGATVFVNETDKRQKSYPGTVAWIADKAEFTPKTIQTQDERQNLVYAVKIAVENSDGFLKIGMYADIDFAK